MLRRTLGSAAFQARDGIGHLGWALQAVSLGVSVPAVGAGIGQGWCLVVPGDSFAS